jgi:RimJ/RimL family protein N-acetyltransferase
MRTITVGIIEDNMGSRRVVEKIGFRLIGTVDRVTPMQGKRDAVLGQWIMQYVVE